MQIDGAIILITGASGGIGKAAAELLAGRGASVALAARSHDKLGAISAVLPGSFAVKTDMCEPESACAMIAATFEHYGRIDVLVNNAGRGMRCPIETMRYEDLDEIMKLNVFGPLVAMQQVIPIMRVQGSGAIVNISSGLSKMAMPNVGGYAASKYALNALSLTAMNELAKDGITVTALYPNMTATDFASNSIAEEGLSWSGHAANAPALDTAEMVAERIAEAIENGPAEEFMSADQEARFDALRERHWVL